MAPHTAGSVPAILLLFTRLSEHAQPRRVRIIEEMADGHVYMLPRAVLLHG